MYVKLFEEFTLSKTQEFISDFGFFVSFNLSKVKDLAIDDKAKNELDEMLKTFRKPIINGMTFSDIANNYNSIKNNPKMLSAVFTQIRAMLIYLEPRLNKFVKDSDIKTAWLNKLDDLKKRYTDIVTTK